MGISIMIRAVLWDFGGVITSSPFEAFNQYERENGFPIDFIRTVNSKNPDTNAWAQFERNEITVDEFAQKFSQESKLLGQHICGKTVLSLIAGKIRPEMVKALKLLKNKLTIGCITNNMLSGKGASMARNPERAEATEGVLNLFDVVIESSKLGVRKPDPRIYKIACDQLAIAPNEAVFLDDLGINLKPARAMGMFTIKVVSSSQALDDLQAYLNFPIR